MKMGTVPAASCIALLLLLIFLDNCTPTVLCMSLSAPQFLPRSNTVISRRLACFDAMASFWTTVILITPNDAASAACLQGDLSKECIGIYKVPVPWDDQTDRATIENLKTFAPELNYEVPRLKRPKTNRVARQTLEQQQVILQETAINLVSAGRLEEAGICLLGVIPKVTSAGSFIVQSMENDGSSNNQGAIAEIRLVRLQSQYQLLLGLLGQADVSIGQALRGDIPGTITMAVRSKRELVNVYSSSRDRACALMRG
jgi:hypothetical protein